jgi:ABC-type enterochelin transport system substrate-binding protein
MKKVLAIVTGVVFVSLVACGPSAEEQKKMEDALKAAADSAANALLQQASDAATAPADTTAHADSTAH